MNCRIKLCSNHSSHPVAPWIALVFLLCAVMASAQGEYSEHSALQDSVETLQVQARYAEAQTLAEKLVAVVSQDSTAHPYEITDAQLLLAKMKTVTGLSRQDQVAFAEADSLQPLVEGLFEQGQYGEAVDLTERSIEIYERLLGQDHPDVALSLNNLAQLYNTQGLYAQAEPLFKRALVIQEKGLGTDHPELAISLNNLALLYNTQGQYAQAEPLYKRSLAINEETLGPDHPYVATNLNNLAALYRKQGQYTNAEPLFLRALEIREKVLGPDQPEVAMSLNSLAMLYYKQGQYMQAEPLLKRALVIYEEVLGPDHPYVANSLQNLAVLYSKLGQYVQAEPLYERALVIFEMALGPDHPNVAASLNSLAGMYYKLGQYKQAEPLFKRALEIRKKALGPDHPDVATSLNNLAGMYSNQGQFAQAVPLFKRALEINEEALGPGHPDVANSLNKLAGVYSKQSQYAKAEPLFLRAMEIYDKALGPDHPDVVSSLVGIAELYLSTSHPDSAATMLFIAANRFESARLRVARGIARATFEVSPYPPLAIASLSSGNFVQAWPATENACGRALADLLVATRRRPLTEMELAREDSLATEVKVLEPRLATLIKAAHGDSSAEAEQLVQTTRLELLAADARLSEFAQAMAQKYPISEGQSYPLKRVQAVLGKDQAIVGWLDFEIKKDEHLSWAYVVRDRGPVTWVPLPKPAKTASASPYEQARACRSAFDPAEHTDVAVAAFSETRVQPLLSELDGIEDLIVIQTGAMGTIPVEALMDEQGRPLVDRFTISYAPSATIYTWLQEERRKTRPINDQQVSPRKTLLLGDPPFTPIQRDAMMAEEQTIAIATNAPVDGATLRGAVVGDELALAALPRLRGTRVEVRAISELADEATVLLGPEASEQTVVELAESGKLGTFQSIHVATHALVDQERPERSCLVLSRADLPDAYEAAKRGERIYDGRLTVQEVLQEWELDADLVTLSACETGLGQDVQGEGLVGFSHAFLQAGAHSLLVSLWKVDDRATSLLMTRFYINLWQGKMPKAVALREAKNWLREYVDEMGQRPYMHPYFWSAFILIGDRG